MCRVVTPPHYCKVTFHLHNVDSQQFDVSSSIYSTIEEINNKVEKSSLWGMRIHCTDSCP
jgi:hypothetical protein